MKRNINLNTIHAAIANRAGSLLTSENQKINANELAITSQVQYHSSIDATSGGIPTTSGWMNALLNFGLHSSATGCAQIFMAYKMGFFVRSSQNEEWEAMITSKNIGKYIEQYLKP